MKKPANVRPLPKQLSLLLSYTGCSVRHYKNEPHYHLVLSDITFRTPRQLLNSNFVLLSMALYISPATLQYIYLHQMNAQKIQKEKDTDTTYTNIYNMTLV